jgi:multicomponent Na+:H+ antiporter subunit D
VSHIGYMIFGIALADEAGLGASIFYVTHHITVQTTLFLVVGLVERRGGTTSLERLGGLAKIAPGLAILFFIPAMSLAGIPPLSGFLGKIGLLQAGVQVGTPLTYTLVVGSVVTSILTLYAIVKAWNKAFWQTPPEPIPETRLPVSLVGPTTALVGLGLLITVVAGPLYSYTDRAAHTLLDNSTYIDAVLGPDGRGTGQSSDEVEDADAEQGGGT